MPFPKPPSFKEERKLWRKGFSVVLGVDEVGRGSWAGPVVAAAVVFSAGPAARQPHAFPARLTRRGPPRGAPRLASPALKTISHLGINDSKALRSRKRAQLADKIKECSMGWAIGAVRVGIINKVGIGKTTQMAMRKTISEILKTLKRSVLLEGRTSAGKIFVLVDAFHIKYLKGVGLKNQKAIVKGDQKSLSIASASILAKVYRDNLMKRLARKHPRYGWGRNKGYGTKEHQGAILKHGVTCLHRKKFVETFLKKVTL